MTTTLDAPTEKPATGPTAPRRRGILVAVGFAAVLGLLAVATSVEVVVTVPIAPVEAPVAVAARTVPLRAEASRRVEARATGALPAATAVGEVTFVYWDSPVLGRFCMEHGDCPPLEITVPAGTRVGTCAGGPVTYDCSKLDVQFVTLSAVRVHLTASSALVPVKAVVPGARGNVGVATIRGIEGVRVPPNSELTVDNNDVTTGGADEEPGPVARAEVDRVAKAQGARLRIEAVERLEKAAAAKGLTLAGDLRVDVRAEALPLVDSSSTAATVVVTATAHATGFPEDDLRREATRALEAARPPGRFLVPDSVRWDSPVVEGERVRATARAEVSAVDADAVARRLRGRRPGPADRALEAEYGTGSVVVRRLLPLPVLPFFASRIDVEVQPAG